MEQNKPPVLGVILAGGQGRRLGHVDKAMVAIAGRPLLELVIARLHPQAPAMLISANADPLRFASFGLPVVADSLDDAGPLAGVLAGMEWAKAHMPAAEWIATVAVDTPFFPSDYIARLGAGVAQGAKMARAVSNHRAHPVFGMWPVCLAVELRSALETEGMRKVGLWTARFNCADVIFTGETIDPFFNINTPGDEKIAEAELLRAPIQHKRSD